MPKLRQLLFGASCLLCAAVALAKSLNMMSMEEGGGSVTGPVIEANVAGGGLLIAAAIAVFFRPRIAAGVALLASLLCLPLYLYKVEPRAFLEFFPGRSALQLPEGFIWNDWAIVGLVAVLATALFSVWNLSSKS